jgi:hypothetical protein
VSVKREPFEDVANVGMQNSLIREFIQAAELPKGRIELKQRLWPQLALIQLTLDHLTDLRIGNPQETVNVRFVVGNDSGMRLEDIHSRGSP